MKKIALCSLLMCLGFVDYAMADKTFEISNDNTPSNEEIYLIQDIKDREKGKTKALQCESGKFPDGSYIYVKGSHYRKTTKKTNNAFYKCAYRGDDEWNPSSEKALPECDNASAVKFIENVNDIAVYGIKLQDKENIGDGQRVYIDVCKKSSATDQDCLVDASGNSRQYTYDHENACWIMPRDCNIVGQCSGKRAGDSCSYNKLHAKTSMCVNIKRTSNSQPELTCAAKECQDGYLLWLSAASANNQSPISMGICHKKSDVENRCLNGCRNCNGENQKCVPNLMPNPNTGKANTAYFDCRCETEEQQVSTNCTYTFRVKCADGTEVTGLEGYPIVINYNQVSLKSVQSKYDLTDTEIGQCINGKTLDGSLSLYAKMWNADNTEFADKLKTNMTLNKKILDFCNSRGGYGAANMGGGSVPGGTPVVVNSAEFENAKKTLETFATTASKEASGWKTAEGKFNTMRLASDLSAGVVLGTVGGVVSGVVIKKKQVEKGFDALHCTVGGQTVADWGDEFSVGLNR